MNSTYLLAGGAAVIAIAALVFVVARVLRAYANRYDIP